MLDAVRNGALRKALLWGVEIASAMLPRSFKGIFGRVLDGMAVGYKRIWIEQ